MTSGTILLLLTLLAPSGGPSSQEGVVALIESLAAARPSEIAFRETRVSALLEEPAEVRGRLSFVPPDRLEKQIDHPRAISQIIAGDRVRVRYSDGRQRTFSLSRAPELQALSTVLLAVLRGDPKPLLRDFDAYLDEDEDGWSLTLIPTTERIAERLTWLRISGTGDSIRRCEMLLADGERVRTELEALP